MYAYGHEQRGKQHGKRDPDRRPSQRFLEFDHVSTPVENAEVQRQKKKNAQNETTPMPGRNFDEGDHGHAHEQSHILTLLSRQDNEIRISIKIRNKNQAFAGAAAVPMATCDPMAGRCPLCHHSTIALAM